MSNDDFTWKMRARGGYQRSFGDVDPKYLSGVLVFGGSTGVQLSNGFAIGAGASYGRQNPEVQDNAHTIQRLLLGGSLGYNDDAMMETVGMHAGLGVSYMRMWQDTRVGYDPSACEDGSYSCLPGGGADIGDTGTGSLTDTSGLDSFVTAGNAVTEISPYIYFDFATGPRGTLTAGTKVPIWIVNNIQTNDKDTAGAVLFVFGGEYDPSLPKAE